MAQMIFVPMTRDEARALRAGAATEPLYRMCRDTRPGCLSGGRHGAGGG